MGFAQRNPIISPRNEWMGFAALHPSCEYASETSIAYAREELGVALLTYDDFTDLNDWR